LILQPISVDNFVDTGPRPRREARKINELPLGHRKSAQSENPRKSTTYER